MKDYLSLLPRVGMRVRVDVRIESQLSKQTHSLRIILPLTLALKTRLNAHE